jgi:hypothetical protein
VLVKALVFGGNDGVLQRRRDIGNCHHRPALLAELTDLDALGGVDAQRDFRLVLGQRLQGGQVRIGERDHQREDQHAGHHKAAHQDQGQAEKAEPHRGLDRYEDIFTGCMIPLPVCGELTRHPLGLLLAFNPNSTYRA